jgi:hypothetical protein
MENGQLNESLFKVLPNSPNNGGRGRAYRGIVISIQKYPIVRILLCKIDNRIIVQTIL